MDTHSFQVEGVGEVAVEVRAASGGAGYMVTHRVKSSDGSLRVNVDCRCDDGTSTSSDCASGTTPTCHCPNASITCD